jgi:hypothetical protein
MSGLAFGSKSKVIVDHPLSLKTLEIEPVPENNSKLLIFLL